MTALDDRALNRALLARQFLLRRADVPAVAAIEHLVGLQSQAPLPPYVGLWTRLAGFAMDDLAALLLDRQVVRIALQRSTIHLVSATDALRLRPFVQPVLDRGLAGAYGSRLAGLDLAAVAEAGREALRDGALTFAELGARLAQQWPKRDPAALAQAVRCLVPLVQVPPRGVWGRSGTARHVPIEAWLGAPLRPAPPAQIVRRYLAAFGPATVADVQTWSGVTRLREITDGLDDLWRGRSADGRELLDLPDAPRPDADVPAPVRFLPEFDNVLLSHANRARILDEAHKRRVFTVNGIIRPTVLVDGLVSATWKIAPSGGVVVTPFGRLSKRNIASITAEGRRLARVISPATSDPDVSFADPEMVFAEGR